MVEDDCNYWVGVNGTGHEIVLNFGCITVIDRYYANQKTVIDRYYENQKTVIDRYYANQTTVEYEDDF